MTNNFKKNLKSEREKFLKVGEKFSKKFKNKPQKTYHKKCCLLKSAGEFFPFLSFIFMFLVGEIAK